MISTSDRKNVVFILNVRLNHEYRVNRMLTLLTKLVDYPNAYISIRVRGIFSFSASNEIRGLFHLKKFLNYKIYAGDDFRQWKINTLVQVIDSQGDYFILLQEDHFLISDTINFYNYVNYLIDNNVDLGHITSWYTYSEVRNHINISEHYIENDYGIIYDLAVSPWRYLPVKKPRYVVPLVAYFKKDFLLKILYSARPYWRRYPAFSPFDFEQGPNAEWFLPIKIGFSKMEIFACIDDDIDMLGSSLQSRKLYILDQIRVSEQHDSSVGSLQNNSKKINKLFFRGKYKQGIYANLKNTFTRKIWAHTSNVIIRLFRFYDSVIYTLHSALNNFINIPEILYKTRSKNLIE